jgi:hypothetical protein
MKRVAASHFLPAARDRGPTLAAPGGARRRVAALAGVLAVLLGGCGGSGNPLDNPATVSNPTGSASGQRLSFTYFQRCINPILKTDLQININGVVSTNKCAGSGCHDSNTGKGGALRVSESAPDVADTVVSPGNTIESLRATAMYKNYFSAEGSTIVGSGLDSLLIRKPLNLRVLHGGGLIFLSDTDPNIKLMKYWIENPLPETDDEFSTNITKMFANGDPIAGACNQ